MKLSRTSLLAVVGSLPLFAACGGGGNDVAPRSPSNSTAAAPWVPPPVVIFSNPVPQAYAALGSSTISAGDGYRPVDPGARLANVSLEAPNQPRLRYTASGHYELQLPGASFDRLVHYAGLMNPTPANNFFQPAGAIQNAATFIVSQSGTRGYRHSELASWTDATPPGRAGFLAFGSPTPAAAIPSSGRATYRGHVYAMIDVAQLDRLFGGYYFASIEATLTVTIDFVARTIEGALEIDDPIFTGSVPLSATTLLPGDDTWWGTFLTSESGFNELKVRSTGPGAEELIGSFAVPLSVGGEAHQLMGAWIAARR